MKKLTKMLLVSGVMLVLGAGMVLSYLQAQSRTPQVSDLTLANIEAMGFDTIGEAIDAGCAGCWGVTSSCLAQVTDMATGEIIAVAICSGYYPG